MPSSIARYSLLITGSIALLLVAILGPAIAQIIDLENDLEGLHE